MEVQIIEKSNEKQKNMKIVGTYIDYEHYQLLEKEANESFTSISSIVRKALYTYLKDINRA